MHRTLKKLYRDHAHFNQLIDVMEQQLDELKEGSGTAQNLLREVVLYSHDYSDSIHHPIEDQLYEMMLARTDNGREVMEKLLVHHLQIINMTLALRKAVEASAADKMEEVGRDYVKYQREHMQFEEKEAFPLLRDNLGDVDFDNAAGAIPAEQDPMEDKNAREKYPALFAYLEKSAA